MKFNNIDAKEFKESLSRGLHLSFEKMLKQKKANDGYIIISENGLIKKIKAAEISSALVQGDTHPPDDNLPSLPA